MLDVTDTNYLGVITTRFVLNISVVNMNDPPLLTSPNVTGIPENSALGSTQYQFVSFDEDADVVNYTIIAGNNNTGVYPPAQYALLQAPPSYNPPAPLPAFNLTAYAGQLIPASLLNFELLNSYTLTIFMTDNNSRSLTTVVKVVVNLLDRNDPPWLTSPFAITWRETLVGVCCRLAVWRRTFAWCNRVDVMAVCGAVQHVGVLQPL